MQGLFQRRGIISSGFAALVMLLGAISAWTLADERVAKVYPVKDFAEVHVSGGTRLELTQGDDEYLRVEASPEAMQRVSVDLSGDRLRLGIKSAPGNWFSWFNNDHQDVTFILRVKRLNLLDLSGAAEGRVGDIKQPELEVIGSGASQFDMARLEVGELNINMSGASQVRLESLTAASALFELSGAASGEVKSTSNAHKGSVNASGASNFHGRTLRFEELDLEASGASSVEISVSKSLDAEASGASHIRYYGAPKVTTKATGASSIEAKAE